MCVYIYTDLHGTLYLWETVGGLTSAFTAARPGISVYIVCTYLYMHLCVCLWLCLWIVSQD